MIRFITPALLAISAFALAAPATAETKDTSETIRFTFDPDAPAKEIYADLRKVARQACRMESSTPLDFARTKEELRCRADFMRKAVDILNMPDVVALHRGKSNKSIRVAESAA